MKYLTGPTMTLFIFLLLTSCDSKKDAKGDQPAEPVFGLYKHNNSNNIVIKLNEDSTAVLDMDKTRIQKATGTGAVHKEGIFTCRNDSIFISWDDGDKRKSKFERKAGSYSFLIGSTRYEKKL